MDQLNDNIRLTTTTFNTTIHVSHTDLQKGCCLHVCTVGTALLRPRVPKHWILGSQKPTGAYFDKIFCITKFLRDGIFLEAR